MAKLIIQGQAYPLPDFPSLTFDELERFAPGLALPGDGQGITHEWLRALVLIAKDRAKETIPPDFVKNLTLGDVDTEEDPAPPPPNRAQRRAQKSGSGETQSD